MTDFLIRLHKCRTIDKFGLEVSNGLVCNDDWQKYFEQFQF